MSRTLQPSWHCVANLGDVNPLEQGGNFVVVDKRGIYDPELWIWDADKMQQSTVCLERCFPAFIGPHKWAELALGNNRFHPYMAEWFGEEDRLKSAASTCGMRTVVLRDQLMSSNPVERAEGYCVLVANFGIHEFDSSPNEMTRTEAGKLCRKLLSQIKQTDKWKDGI